MPVELETIKSLADVKSEPKLLAFVLTEAKRLHCQENVMFFFAKGNEEGLYGRYLSPKSATQINLDSKLQGAFDKLAEAKDWKNAAWGKLLDAARNEANHMFLRDTKPKILKSKEYAAYVEANRPKKTGDPAKAAKLLGIGDIAKLKKAFEYKAKGDSKNADKLMDEIAKEEKMKDKAAAIWKSLEKAGLV